MFLTKIFVTLLLIQSLQLTIAQQDDDDLGSIESLPRFEARRQSAANGKEDFEYDDEDDSARGPVNPLPARTGRNEDNTDEDDFDDNQPQNNVQPAPVPVVVGPAPTSVKGQPLTSSSGRLSLPRFPGQQVNSFVAPLPAPVAPAPIPVRPTVVPVISSPVAPITVSGKTNFGKDSSGSLSVPRLVKPAEPTKTVRVVKTRVFRPNPVSVDQSAGPNVIVSGGVKSVPIFANSKVQPPRLRVVTTRRPTTPLAPVDVDEDAAADSRPAPAPVQISGVKTIASANPVPLVPFSRFAPARPVQPIVAPVRQPSRLEVIYADERFNTQEQDEDDEDGNAAGLSQPNIVKFNRPSAPVPVRAAPQPYLVPLNVQGPRPVQPISNGVFFQPTLQSRPTLVSSGKTNAIKSTFNVRPQPVPVAPVQPAPNQVFIDSGSASGSQQVVTPVVSKVQPPRVRVITTQRPTTPVQIIDEDGLSSGVKGSGISSGSRPLVRTPRPTARPLVQVQVQEEPLPTFQQIDLIRTQPAPRPVINIQENFQPRPTVSVAQPAPRPTLQPIVQIRDGAASAELPLPAPPRPIQIVRVTPAPTVRPITQITQVRESALPSVQPVQISQPRLVPVAPQPQPQVIQISEPARPLTQVRETALPSFQPLDPALRPAIPNFQVTSEEQETAAPRETIVRQPVRPIQVIQRQPVRPIQFIQPQPLPQVQQQVVQVQQPSVETVQLKESAIPIPSSQGNLGTQTFSRPQPVQTIVNVPQEPVPVQQPFEILRLREPNFPQVQVVSRQPQPVVPVRRLVPAPLPSQPAALPVARPNLVQFSQEKEIVSVAQPAPAPVVIQQQQRPVSFPSIQQIQTNVAPAFPAQRVQLVEPIAQPRPLVRQPSVPRLVAPLPLPQPGQEFQSLGQPITVQTRVTQPQQTVLIQQQRPSVVISQPQPAPAPVVIQQQRPFSFQQFQPNVAPLVIQQQRPVAPVAPLPAPSSSSQPGEQQIVQIREKVSSIPDDFSQIEQVRLARA